MGSSSSSEKVDMSGPEAKLVKETIHDNPVVVFSKTYCPSCRRVKELLDSLNAKYEVVELDKRSDGKKMQAVLHKMTGASTVPRVFIGEECLGGSEKVEALHKKGVLVKKLEAVSAL